jgi:Fe-S cluster biogenesis protein NfuA
MSRTRVVASMSDVETRLAQALERIRPAMQMDGGDIHLVGWSAEDGLVRVALSGACNGCHMSSMTMTMGVERVLKQLVPEVRAVEAV